MNHDQARKLVADTFRKPFDKGRFSQFVSNLLNHIDLSKAFTCNSQYVKNAFKLYVARYERLASFTTPDQRKIDILIVSLTNDAKLARVRTRTALRNFVAYYLKNRDRKDAALVAFVSPSESAWRFSYVKMEYATVETSSGTIGSEARLTPARRFSYIVGPGESCHTAQARFLALLQNTQTDPQLMEIEEAFSVEAVTKEFFARYKELVLEVKEELDKLAASDKAVSEEFATCKVNTVDFAKKLMGQIVFLYFLQKKGWLGVAKDGQWGAGPHDFLRKLANGNYGPRKNFFNDTLEPLFYDTLATDRGHEAFCSHFNCRIPFLNGGLFEPLNNYNWRKTEILLPNRLFTNAEQVEPRKPNEEAITGTGILDVFDRYNFTVNEAEPLEKEVAIDPEMLGKVFENLLGVQERKSKGSFYTPREIVHYMCQESLINYLDTAVNGEIMLVSHADTEALIHTGDQASDFEAARIEGTISYKPHLPASIETHARLLDEKLAAITVCDPAVGSGAFLVGMMQEIVRARHALTPYFNDANERTAYHFKRHAIQNCLYGVDIDPGAVEIAKLRLWLSLVVDEEETKQIKPLPNLDYKVVAGNSLLGFPFKSERLHQIETLKHRFFDETNHEKKMQLKSQIDTELYQAFANSKRSLGYEVNFDFDVVFSEVFHHGKGFDVVVANPPYIDSEAMTTNSPKMREQIQTSYKWTKGNWDIYIAFYEKAFGVLAGRGSLSFITPDKWISKPFGDEMRTRTTGSLLSILRAGRDVFENANVDSIVTVYSKAPKDNLHIRDYTSGRTNALRTIQKGTLKPPYTYDWLFSRHIDRLAKIETAGANFSDLGICENACATSDAYKLKEFIVEDSSAAGNEQFLKVINTGTIGKYLSKWGRRPMTYLGEKYARPVVPKSKFLAAFQNSYGRKAVKPKIIIKGLNLLDACLDGEGTVIPGKTTLIVTCDHAENLATLLAVLNNPVAQFYLREKYPASSYNQGITFTKDMIEALPVPAVLLVDSAPISGLVGLILAEKEADPEADTRSLEREVDQIIYQLYNLTPEEIAIVEGA